MRTRRSTSPVLPFLPLVLALLAGTSGFSRGADPPPSLELPGAAFAALGNDDRAEPRASKARLAGSRPNIVLILADDMGYECVGANGAASYETPFLDRLAASGLRFEHCYSQPLCTPSRVQLMTGIYNNRNYVRFGLLPEGSVTFAHILETAGYATCVVGKWQLEGGLDGPHDAGFDEYCLWQVTRRPGRYPNPGIERNGELIDTTGGEYGPDVVSDYLLDFIERHREGPFFAYYPMILPHWPFEPTPDSPDWDPEAKGVLRGKGDPRYFPDMVRYVDKMVAKVVGKLDDLGIRDETLVLFTADNGTARGIRSRLGDRVVVGGKGLTTDAGTRVPFIASWPGKVPRGEVSRDLVDFSDFFPTLAELAGAPLPDGARLDGRSFAPQLGGEEGRPREWIYCWYSRNGGPQGKEFARTRRYKLYSSGRFFDVAKDPREEEPIPREELDPEERAVRERLERVLATHERKLSRSRGTTKERPSREAAVAERSPDGGDRGELGDPAFLLEDGTIVIRVPVDDGEASWGDVLAGLAEARGFEPDALQNLLPSKTFEVTGVGGRLAVAGINVALSPALRLRIRTDEEGERHLEILLDDDALLASERRFKSIIRRALLRKLEGSERDFGLRIDDGWKEAPPDRPLVVALGGLDASPRVFDDVLEEARRLGFPAATFSYPNDQPIAESARLLARELREIAREEPERRVTLVTHSMGGLVAREAIENPELDPGNIRQLVQVAPPNRGSALAPLAFGLEIREHARGPEERKASERLYAAIEDGLSEAAEDLEPDSLFLEILNARTRNPKVDYSILLGTGALLGEEALESWRRSVRMAGRKNRYARFFGAKLEDHLRDLDEVVRGKGDGAVAVSRGRLEGVQDIEVLDFHHAILSAAPRSEAARRLREEVLERITGGGEGRGRGNGNGS